MSRLTELSQERLLKRYSLKQNYIPKKRSFGDLSVYCRRNGRI